MNAIQLVRPGAPLELRQVPRPTTGPNDILVRVRAAGICHSDAHYRAGRSRVEPLPLTLGHEVAGSVEEVGAEVREFQPGDRVCVHYLATCGHCLACAAGTEQFCSTGKMIGKYRDGGYAEFLLMPARSLFHLPSEIPYEIGAILMCSAATALHALKKARMKRGDTVAVFGLGGLGISAVQLARTMGATTVFGVDINRSKLALAEKFGVRPIDASREDPVAAVMRETQGKGVDVSLELIGLPATMRQAVLCLGVQGRAALAGITEKCFELYPYHELLNKEAEVIGVSDHLAAELPELLEYARDSKLDLSSAITRTVSLDATAINAVLDELERFGDSVRVVIVP